MSGASMEFKNDFPNPLNYSERASHVQRIVLGRESITTIKLKMFSFHAYWTTDK
jgi:hypothetical protein